MKFYQKIKTLLLVIAVLIITIIGNIEFPKLAYSLTNNIHNQPIDIDLSHFNSNMLYAEVYNMSLAPQNYIGKTIKLTGKFSYYQQYDKLGNPLTYGKIPICVIGDTMGCCWIEIKIVPINIVEFDRIYPAHDSTIAITGICDVGYNSQLRTSSLIIRQADIKVLK